MRNIGSTPFNDLFLVVRLEGSAYDLSTLQSFEGQAKYLITEYGFNAEQIAEVWDLEDGCGGTEHVGGEH